ncbi:MAG TPA: hypothetical protein DGG95_05185 [Cytophagales bacterium]|nr:hypothetical protein [Cytophagales bacterium]
MLSIHLAPKAVQFGFVADQLNFPPKSAWMEILNQPIRKSLRQTAMTLVTECTRVFRLINVPASCYSLFYEMKMHSPVTMI